MPETDGENLRRRLDGMGKVSMMEAAARRDGFLNPISGVGVWGVDKRIGSFAHIKQGDYQDWANLYRADDMAGRIVDALPDECARKGFSVQIKSAAEDAEAAEDALYELEATEQCVQGHKFARAYGGGGLFIGANDGRTADRPLNEAAIQSVDWLIPLDTMELVANSYYTSYSTNGSKYGLPETYRLNRFGAISPVPSALNGSGAASALELLSNGQFGKPGAGDWNLVPIVHESRIVRFEGVFINRIQMRAQRYWGDSIFVRCENVLRDFDLSWSSAAILLQDFAQAVIKMKGMSQLISAQGPSALGEAARMIEMGRSTARAVVLDSEDEYERKPTPTTGLPELLQQFARRLAAAADMPVTRLMGESPAGLNATGDQDADWWADKVLNAQNMVWRRPLNRICKLLFLAKKGPTKGVEPKSWRIKFHPLKQLTDLEQAQRRLAVAQTDQIYVSMQGVTPEEVVVTRFGGDEYNADKIQLSEVDPEKRALAAAEQAEAAASLANPPGAGTSAGEEEEPGKGTAP